MFPPGNALRDGVLDSVVLNVAVADCARAHGAADSAKASAAASSALRAPRRGARGRTGAEGFNTQNMELRGRGPPPAKMHRQGRRGGGRRGSQGAPTQSVRV